MKVIDDIFDSHELEYIKKKYSESLAGVWQINRYHWQDILTVGTDGLVLMQDVDPTVRKLVEKAVNNHVQFSEPPGIMFYMWTTGSGINWHHDDHVKKACTIYLEDWPLNYGGQLVYKEDRANKLVPVKENRLVINDNHTEHMVTKVQKNNERIRYTLQVFGV